VESVIARRGEDALREQINRARSEKASRDQSPRDENQAHAMFPYAWAWSKGVHGNDASSVHK
jgi:hypothetical protein